MVKFVLPDEYPPSEGEVTHYNILQQIGIWFLVAATGIFILLFLMNLFKYLTMGKKQKACVSGWILIIMFLIIALNTVGTLSFFVSEI